MKTILVTIIAVVAFSFLWARPPKSLSFAQLTVALSDGTERSGIAVFRPYQGRYPDSLQVGDNICDTVFANQIEANDSVLTLNGDLHLAIVGGYRFYTFVTEEQIGIPRRMINRITFNGRHDIPEKVTQTYQISRNIYDSICRSIVSANSAGAGDVYYIVVNTNPSIDYRLVKYLARMCLNSWVWKDGSIFMRSVLDRCSEKLNKAVQSPCGGINKDLSAKELITYLRTFLEMWRNENHILSYDMRPDDSFIKVVRDYTESIDARCNRIIKYLENHPGSLSQPATKTALEELGIPSHDPNYNAGAILNGETIAEFLWSYLLYDDPNQLEGKWSGDYRIKELLRLGIYFFPVFSDDQPPHLQGTALPEETRNRRAREMLEILKKPQQR